MTINIENILDAIHRIQPYIKKTSLETFSSLNDQLGHDIFFKTENTQITGAFKVRGVLNTLLQLIEAKQKPKKLVAYSSGNHARAIAYVAKLFNIEAELYMHHATSQTKQQAIRELGANLILTERRIDAEELSKKQGLISGNFFLHPSDNDYVIAGAATLAFESIHQTNLGLDAIFASCGGGALLSGIVASVKSLNQDILVFGCEPVIANDAAISYRSDKIFSFPESPLTIADGLRTLKLSERTFKYLKKLNGFIEVEEKAIEYWTAWLNHLIKLPCEPTACTAMAGAHQWMKEQKTRKKILIILSGGNIDTEVNRIIASQQYLDIKPGYW